MDDSEALVKEHLAYLGFERIVYEPDGSNPPDFLVDDRIAVEVRRLNQNAVTKYGRRPRGLEEDRIPTERRLHRLLHSLGPATSGDSWFVTYSIRRPVARWDDIEPVLRAELEQFRDDPTRQRLCRMKVAEGFEIQIVHKASKSHPTCFVYGGGSDWDSGGFILAETQRNLRLCVADKLKRIARVRERYPVRWLMLVDRIGFGVNASDLESFRAHLAMDSGFDRLVILSPLDARWSFEVPSRT